VASIENITVYRDVDPYTSMTISLLNIGLIDYSLYANPSDFEWQFGAKRKEVSENLVGNFESNYLDDYDIINVSATTGAFKHPQYGVTHYRREESHAYQKFVLLMEMIKNNSIQYSPNGRPEDVSPAIISYLGASWLGNFISFSYTEEENTPNNFTFEFEFQVERNLVQT